MILLNVEFFSMLGGIILEVGFVFVFFVVVGVSCLVSRPVLIGNLVVQVGALFGDGSASILCFLLRHLAERAVVVVLLDRGG